MQRLILLEFNELCPSLLEKWMHDGELPNFTSFYGESDVFVTQSDEMRAPNLEPWIQWYSVHTGLPYREHQVFHLTDGPKAPHADIWNVLLARGKTVWNCSSMNARRLTGPNAYFLPDPWCDSELPNPPELQAFSKIVSQQVKEYSNSDHATSLGDLYRFVTFMLTHGLSFETVSELTYRICADALSGGRGAWRRAVLLDMLLFDVFRHYYRKAKPDFSTFFLNSTAHLQHTYWRHMEPSRFSVLPSEADIERFGDAVLFGYKSMDRLLGKFMRLAGNDAVLVFATALSQQPFLKYEAIGGQNFYRPRSIESLLLSLGIRPAKVEPVMTHQFLARFESVEEALSARHVLETLTVSGTNVFGFDPADGTSLYFGCQLRTRIEADEVLCLNEEGSVTPFFDIFYRIEALKSGCHHPDGCLWIRRGHHAVHPGKVSILDIFPTVLDHFGIETGSCFGTSLLDAKLHQTGMPFAAVV